MNWRAATPQQLRLIVWDTGANPVHRQEAEAELLRRRPKRWSELNQKIRRVYPR